MDKLPTQIIDGKEFRLYPNNKYFTDGSIRAHVWLWKKHFGEIPKGFHIHHVNGDPHCNEIENLEMIKCREHLSAHAKQRVKENPEWFNDFHSKGVKAAAEKMTEWRRTEEGKEFHKTIGAMSYANAEYKDYTCQQCGKTFQSRIFHKGPDSRMYPKYCHLNCRAKAAYHRRKKPGR